MFDSDTAVPTPGFLCRETNLIEGLDGGGDDACGLAGIPLILVTSACSDSFSDVGR